MKRSDRRSLTSDPPAVPSAGHRVSGQYVGFGAICRPSCCSQRCLQTHNLLPNAALADGRQKGAVYIVPLTSCHTSKIKFSPPPLFLPAMGGGKMGQGVDYDGGVWDVLLKDPLV